MRTNTEPWCIFCVNFEYLILMDMGKMQLKSQLLMMLWYISKLSILITVDFEQLHVDWSELSQRSVFGISWVEGVHTTVGSLNSTLNITLLVLFNKKLSFKTKSMKITPQIFDYQRLISWLSMVD